MSLSLLHAHFSDVTPIFRTLLVVMRLKTMSSSTKVVEDRANLRFPGNQLGVCDYSAYTSNVLLETCKFRSI